MSGDPGVPHDQGVKEAIERVQARRENEASDRANVALADQQLLEDFGTADFESGRRMVQKYLTEEATPAELEAIRTAAGGQPLNAAQWKAIAQRAIGPIPTRRAWIEAELAANRKRMREDRAGWFADDRAHIRHRALLRAAGKG